jgi:hypothetical protein
MGGFLAILATIRFLAVHKEKMKKVVLRTAIIASLDQVRVTAKLRKPKALPVRSACFSIRARTLLPSGFTG